MEKDVIRIALSIIAGFFVLWYCGAMFNFFPFFGNDSVLNAIGFTGLLICAVIAGCACWIVCEIKKNR